MTINQIPEKAAETAVQNTVMGADLVTGAAVTAAEAMTRPIKTLRAIERKGAPVNRAASRKVSKQMDDLVEEGVETVEALMPERVLRTGIKLLKNRARRKDLVGDAAYFTLDVVNDSISALAGFVRRFEELSEPPVRNGETRRRQTRRERRSPALATRKATATASRARRAAGRSARTTTRRAASTSRRTVRRGTAGARTAERRTA